MNRRIAGLLLLALMLQGGNAGAHRPSDSYLVIQPADNGYSVVWSIAIRDLEDVLGLDMDGDGAVTWGEILGRREAITGYAMSRFSIAIDRAPCALARPDVLVDKRADGAYVVLGFAAACGRAGEALTLAYGLFFDQDAEHRGLLALTRADGARMAAVFSPSAPVVTIPLNAEPGMRFASFFREGLHHLFTGYDHLLFLALVLLPSVLGRTTEGWKPTAGFWRAFGGSAGILSAFTVAHALTLTSAALGVVMLSSRLVECAIALTILVTAIDNVRPFLPGRRWQATFAFGLVHGFGFAATLQPLDLPGPGLAMALLGFNLGIEAGQLLMASLLLPVVFAIRERPVFPRRILPIGSAMAGLLAAIWFAERAFDVRLIGGR
ncbi:MAG: HupE/UreJ family protein [Alphaproteobacteria bacterium]|nr:HupE/UreJ family protein [Alphaproteobacteria bacterium]